MVFQPQIQGMSLNHFFPLRRITITTKSFMVSVIILITGLVFVTLIRPSWSPSVSFSSQQISTKWEEMFQTATAAIAANALSISNKKHNVDCGASATDWDALLDDEPFTGANLVKYLMWTNHSSCELSHDFGGVMMDNPAGLAGQKAVCIDPIVAPKPGDCLIYSFGINDDWSFDEMMARYGCQIFAFDPAPEMTSHDHSPGDIHFYNWGLGSRDEYDPVVNWTIRSLSSIYKTLVPRHGNKTIDYLKIDIEYSEWIALPDIISSGMLSKVRQLGMEIHLDKNATLEEHRGWAKLLRLMEKMGMVRFDSEYNPWYFGNFTKFPFSAFLGYEIAWYNSNYSSASTLKND